MSDTLPTHYDPTTVEGDVRAHWTDPDAYPGVEDAPRETSHAYEYAKRRADGETFYFLDGPPFTSGRMHVGNAWGKVLKDCLLRYHRLRGRDVRARPGYDTHGLPVEVNVEERVRLWVDADDGRLLEAVEAHGAELRREVRVEDLRTGKHPNGPEHSREWTVDGIRLWLGVEPVDG